MPDDVPLQPPLQPWSLGENRVSRFYRGGALLERFRGVPADECTDGDRPEDWIGSTVRSWTLPGAPSTDEGLSRITTAGAEQTILSLLEAAPDVVAGRAFVASVGRSTGVLVKLLDAANRLPTHLHPTRAFARRHLGSFFGKAEAWIVLDVREIAGLEPPNVRLGFRRDVERGELRHWIEAGESEPLLAAMHARPVHPGDVWFVPPGMPHAIGAGVFLVEVQEPTDFSIVLEVAGFPIDPGNANLGLGWDRAIEAVDRRGQSDAAIDALRQPSMPLDAGSGHARSALIGPAAAPFFRAERLSIRAPLAPAWGDTYVVGVVIGGSGRVRTAGGEIAVRAGSTFAVPAAATASLEIEPAGGDLVEIVACLPPPPDALASEVR
ncbi:MAG TPA: class I mannose-6-phosphate isomerase [Candidatus Limnocylindrales bacterium]|nr:class I mannose-6-phosphate isomerase [Candidatus Limnocylindrales bacterium]